MAKKKIKNKGKQVKKTVSLENINNDVTAAAHSTMTSTTIPPVFLKVCRLCESKDGPFLNIFDADKVTAKKIDDLMPFSVTENDDLPHKICFRCSAKLEELYEFIQKCIKTQQNLRDVIGKSEPFITRSKMGKKLWEEKLNKSNMTNDDICNALIKKAMEGIKSISPLPIQDKDDQLSEPKRVTRSKETAASKKETKSELKSDDTDEVPLKQVKLSLEKNDSKPSSNKITRSTKASMAKKKEVTPEAKNTEVQSKQSDANQTRKQEVPQTSSVSQNENKSAENANINSLYNFSFDYEAPETPSIKEIKIKEEKKEEPKKPFNIMDHISMIKVNGVGMLFQCKLCNRNFLKKEVVESHNCAKNGIPKVDILKSIPAPEPPKVSTVKYIKIDGDMKKTLTEKIRRAERSENERNAVIENITTQAESYEPPVPVVKPKPKVGPASKTRCYVIDSDSCASQSSSEPTDTNPVPPVVPSVHFPALPNLNSRFKLVPGPNNIFTLVEDRSATALNSQVPTENSKKPSRKRKPDVAVTDTSDKPTDRDKSESPEIIDIDEQTKPYPVGLFQTVAHSARLYTQPEPAAPPSFTTPAMKKQSYTIVQTGNPSKLLISTKAKAIDVEEAPKKRQRKTKIVQGDNIESKEPYRVTLEDVAPPKDPGFFTFINVDPLLQPSYVLPTDNIIQESQISTSSAIVRPAVETKEGKDKYSCNMCGDSFTREKKLLSHIQSHYTKMDEEDQLRQKGTKKKGKK